MSNEYYNLLNNKIITKKFDLFESYISDLHNQILDVSGNRPTGATGASGANGITSGLILFLDSDGGSIETNGSLSYTPNTNGQKINVNGFGLDSPGIGTFYYTIWMSSSIA
jgi:hypothetical protein